MTDAKPKKPASAASLRLLSANKIQRTCAIYNAGSAVVYGPSLVSPLRSIEVRAVFLVPSTAMADCERFEQRLTSILKRKVRVKAVDSESEFPRDWVPL